MRKNLLPAVIAAGLAAGCIAPPAGRPVAPEGEGVATAARAALPGAGKGGTAPVRPAASGAADAGPGPVAPRDPIDRLLTNFSLVRNPKLAGARAGLVALAKDAARLFPDPRWQGVVSDQGGALITDNGAGVVSNNGGGIVSNNGGSVVANNGGRMAGDAGAYRLLGRTPFGEGAYEWDDATGQIRRLFVGGSELALGVDVAGATRTFSATVVRSDVGTTGTARTTVTGTWAAPAVPSPDPGAPSPTPAPRLGDGQLPTAVTAADLDVDLVPGGDPRLAMGLALRTSGHGDVPDLGPLVEGPRDWSLRVRLPGVDLDWTSALTMPGALGPRSARVVAHGTITVDTPEGPRDTVTYELRADLSAEGGNRATVAITHAASGLTFTTVGRLGEAGVARVVGAASGEPLGRLDVGPGSIMPLRLVLADGSVREWELLPRDWLAGFAAVGLPAGRFPIAAP